MARWIRPSAPLAAAVGALVLGSSAGASEPLRFARHGQPVAAHGIASLHDAANAATLTVFEPYEAREVRFRALPFPEVLDAVFTQSWRDEEELLFTCRDGYQPTVPVRRVLDHRAWLAFERPGGAFEISKLESGRRQRVPLGPFYLIWENLEDSVVRAEGDYGWPYQLVGIELVRARDRFPRMTPPPDAGPRVQEGFGAFRMYCSRCHPLNGEGGAIGPELNAPGSEVGRRDPSWLRRWIDDPSAILSNARMPALDPALPERERILDAILAYLRAMAELGNRRDG